MGSIDDVRDRLSIEDVVGAAVQLKRAGSVYKGLCPFHNEKTPSFIVTPSRGTYKCFGCGKGGDIFSFVMETNHVEFRDALQMLADKAGVTLDAPERSGSEDGLRERIYEMNAAASTLFQSMLAANDGHQARAYLRRRGIAEATARRFGLGYAPGRGEVCKRLREAGYGDEELVTAGLAVAPDDGGPLRDRFWGRLMFPIRDAKGRIQGFGGRVLDDGKPKYLNSPETPVFHKSRALYAIEQAQSAIRGSREAVVVEGYMDALRAHQEGFSNVVATLGTAITEQNLRALDRVVTGLRLVLALDADPAGQAAAIKGGLTALKALPKTTAGGSKRETARIYVATLPDGQDPDDAIAANPEVWRSAVAGAAPLMDHFFALVEASLDRAKPDWRQEAIDTLTPAIGELDGIGVQQTYIERLSELTGVDAHYLRDITPGGPPPGSGRQGGRRRGPAPGPPPPATAADPVRTTEEYLVGLLLLHRPLPPEVRAELETYAPLTAELAPLLAALLAGADPAPAHEELAERLAEAVRRGPPVPLQRLQSALHTCMAHVNDLRARRESADLARLQDEVDSETAHEMSRRFQENTVLQFRLTARVDKVYAQYRHQSASVPEDV